MEGCQMKMEEKLNSYAEILFALVTFWPTMLQTSPGEWVSKRERSRIGPQAFTTVWW